MTELEIVQAFVRRVSERVEEKFQMEFKLLSCMMEELAEMEGEVPEKPKEVEACS